MSTHRSLPDTSREAQLRLAPHLQRREELVYSVVARSERHRATAKEVARSLGVDLNVISGRFSELEGMGLLRLTGVRREGAREWEAVGVI